MSYTQTVTPNLDPEIIVDGQPLNDWLGWCMGYVHAAFGSNTAPSAHQGWLNSSLKHQDQDFPSGVYIPIWFDWYGDIDGTGVKNWGHVAIYKDGEVWSSPLSHKPYADTFNGLQAIIDAFGGTIKYVGWSEDICGTVVIKQEKGMLMVDQNLLTNYYQTLFGRAPDPAAQGWIGQPADVVFQALILSDEYKADIAQRNQETADLQKKIDTLTAANLKLTDQITALKATPAVTPDPSVTVTQSGLWAAFKRILGLGG
jgi:hypothetical protein